MYSEYSLDEIGLIDVVLVDIIVYLLYDLFFYCRVFTIAMYAMSLYCYPLDSILSFGQYMKLSLAESSVVLSLIWSFSATYFFSVYPFLTYPDELLLDVTPCFLHIVFTFTTNFLWSCILRSMLESVVCGLQRLAVVPMNSKNVRIGGVDISTVKMQL